MSPTTVLIGVGNVDRRDDGVGPAVARLAGRALPGVSVVTCPAEVTEILDAWSGFGLAVIIDAAAGGTPGRIRRCAPDELADPVPVSSHDLSLAQALHLGAALGRVPESVVVVAIDVADTGYGVGLSPVVAAALPEAARVVAGIVLDQTQETANQQA